MIWPSLMRGEAEERENPKYAHVERERRFLVDRSALPSLETCPAITIEDRYIRSSRLRLRRMSAPGRADVYKLTRKYGTEVAAARPVTTMYLTPEEYGLLSALPADQLKKQRLAHEEGGRVCLIDLIDGPLKGLVIVEVEGLDAGPPPWPSTEITNDPMLTGGSLAAFGQPAKG